MEPATFRDVGGCSTTLANIFLKRDLISTQMLPNKENLRTGDFTGIFKEELIPILEKLSQKIEAGTFPNSFFGMSLQDIKIR